MAVNLAGLLVIMALAAYITLISVGSIGSAFNDVQVHILPSVSALKDMKVATLRVFSSTMEYLQTDEAGERQETELIEAAVEKFNAGYARYRLKPAMGENNEAKIGPIIMEKWNIFITRADQLRRMKAQGAGPEEMFAEKESFESVEMALLDSIDLAVREEEREIRAWKGKTEEIIADNKKWIFALVTASVVLAALIFYQLLASLKGREEMEKNLASTNRAWEMNFKAMRDGAIIADPQGKVLKVNPAFIGIIGRPEDALLGKNVAEIFQEAGVDLKISLKQAGSTEVYAKKIGAWLSISSSASLDDRQMAKEILLILRDITSLKRAEEVLAARNEELEKFRQIVVDRELRMIELKKQVKEAALGRSDPARR